MNQEKMSKQEVSLKDGQFDEFLLISGIFQLIISYYSDNIKNKVKQGILFLTIIEILIVGFKFLKILKFHFSKGSFFSQLIQFKNLLGFFVTFKIISVGYFIINSGFKNNIIYVYGLYGLSLIVLKFCLESTYLFPPKETFAIMLIISFLSLSVVGFTEKNFYCLKTLVYILTSALIIFYKRYYYDKINLNLLNDKKLITTFLSLMILVFYYDCIDKNSNGKVSLYAD